MSTYTGPTGIRFENGHLHIDGYPDAERLVKMPPPFGTQIARLRQHQSDLIFCEQAMQEFGLLREQRPLAANAIWVAVLVKFFSCFGDNKAAPPLSPTRAYKNRPDAIALFRYLKDLRNKHVVHNESSLTYAPTGVVLGRNADVQDIVSLRFEPSLQDEAHSQQMYNLIVYTLKFVASEINATLAKGFEALHAMPPEQRAALPALQYTVPFLTQVASTRSY